MWIMSDKVPDNYFDDLPGRIQGRIESLQDDLEKHAPVLSSIDKRTVYDLPEFYFAESRNKLLKQRQRSRVLKFDFRRIAVAASLALLIAFGVDSVFDMNTSGDQGFAEAEVLDYYLDNIDELDFDLIAEMELEDTDFELSFTEEISDEELDMYLSDIIDEFSAEELYNTIESLN